MAHQDRVVLRELAQRYVDICQHPEQDARRDVWRRLNSLEQTRPPIYVRAFAFVEMEASQCLCEDALFREYESILRYKLFWHSMNDDSVFEPWITVKATKTCVGWGIDSTRQLPDEEGGSYKYDYAIKTLGDAEKLRKPWHGIDEEQTEQKVGRLQDVIGDILTVDCDRSPSEYDIGLTDSLGRLRGIEHLMLDMLDNPDWLHRLIRFMAESTAEVYDQAEVAGDWGLSPHAYTNQAMAYAEELDDPAPNRRGVKRKRLWRYVNTQDFTGVSPAMQNEFLLQYQLPVLERFGLVAFGCCEDLTNKIDMLRQVPNLRRIAVTPAADVARCAEQIGQDYVMSYRPSPADMVSYGLDDEQVRAIMKREMESCRGCHYDITLKDVETVEGDPDRVRNWVRITRGVIDELYGSC